MQSQFSQTMAEMIARARPQQAPPSRGHAVMGGGGGMSENFRATSANIDLQQVEAGIKRLIGYKDPKEVDDAVTKMAEAFEKEKLTNDPQVMKSQELSLVNPVTQTMLGEARKRNHPLVRDVPTEEQATPYGLKKYTFATSTPSLESQKAQVFAGLPEADKQREVKRAPSEVEVASGLGPPGARETFTKTQQDIKASMHPSEINLNLARERTEEETLKMRQEQIKLLPEEWKMKQSENRMHEKLINKQMQAVDLEMMKINKELSVFNEGLSKVEQQGVLAGNKAFDDYKKAWIPRRAMVPTTNEQGAYQALAELEGAVHEHIADMKFQLKDSTASALASEKSVKVWFSQADREFERPRLSSTTLWSKLPLTEVTPTQVTAEQEARRRYYIRAGAEMLKTSGSQSGENYGKLMWWALRTDMSKDKVYSTFRDLGFTDSQIDELLGAAVSRGR